jgi:hypothetical protein
MNPENKTKKTKKLLTEGSYVTSPVYTVEQITGRGLPIFISKVTARSLRVLPAVRTTDFSLKEPLTDFSILYIWSRSPPSTEGVPRRRDCWDLM